MASQREGENKIKLVVPSRWSTRPAVAIIADLIFVTRHATIVTYYRIYIIILYNTYTL